MEKFKRTIDIAKIVLVRKWPHNKHYHIFAAKNTWNMTYNYYQKKTENR